MKKRMKTRQFSNGKTIYLSSSSTFPSMCSSQLDAWKWDMANEEGARINAGEDRWMHGTSLREKKTSAELRDRIGIEATDGVWPSILKNNVDINDVLPSSENNYHGRPYFVTCNVS